MDYSKYQFVLDWNDLPEDFREDKITEYVKKGEKRDCEKCDGGGEIEVQTAPDDSQTMKCVDCNGSGVVDPDPDDLHQREEAEEDIRHHFPIYF